MQQAFNLQWVCNIWQSLQDGPSCHGRSSPSARPSAAATAVVVTDSSGALSSRVTVL